MSLIGLCFPAILAGCATLFTCFFFRDPERRSDSPEKALLSPADGRVLSVERIEAEKSPSGADAFKVSIFMSLFNVHVNRVPCSGTIRKISYRAGKFFAASLDKASELNERTMLYLDTEDNKRIVFIQIAGLIARRIVCWLEKDDEVTKGQRFGLIRFGSRLEVFMPADSLIEVEPGQKATAGKTVLGYLQ